MLQEGRNTITIPSSFLLRILAYLNRSARSEPIHDIVWYTCTCMHIHYCVYVLECVCFGMSTLNSKLIPRHLLTGFREWALLYTLLMVWRVVLALTCRVTCKDFALTGFSLACTSIIYMYIWVRIPQNEWLLCVNCVVLPISASLGVICCVCVH